MVELTPIQQDMIEWLNAVYGRKQQLQLAQQQALVLNHPAVYVLNANDPQDSDSAVVNTNTICFKTKSSSTSCNNLRLLMTV